MSADSDALDEVTPDLVQRIEDALAEDRKDEVRALLADMSAAGQADVLEQVSEPQRDALIDILKGDLDPEALTELDEEVLEDVLDQLDSKQIAAVARELETDDAAFILEELPEDERREVLAEIPAEERADIEQALGLSRGQRRPDDAAFAGQGAAELERRPGHRLLPRSGRPADDVYDLFVVDRSGRLRGSVPLGRMLRSKRPVPIRDIVDPDIPSVPVTADQAEVAHLFRDQNLVSCPVVDDKGRLLGVIMVDDVVDVIDEEAEEDLLKMGGVGSTTCTPTPCAPCACVASGWR